MISTITLVVLICTTSLLFTGINNNNIGVDAFLVMPSYPTIKSSTIIKSTTSIVAQRFNQQQEQFFYRNDNNNLILYAGGFEWEDPIETISADSIDNPYKNPSLLQQKSEGTDEPLVIDPARLLSPRLHGSNLYFIGMMGSGKSTIAQLIAKRKLFNRRFGYIFFRGYRLRYCCGRLVMTTTTILLIYSIRFSDFSY